MTGKTRGMTESDVEDAALGWFEELGYTPVHGPDIGPEEDAAERDTWDQVVLVGRLREAVARLNPDIPEDAREDAVRRVLRTETPDLVENNRRFHRMLVDGVEVEFSEDDRTKADVVRLIDFDEPGNNEWLAVNQYTVIEDRHNRRPDIVVFVNGLPLGVIELKNPADEKATVLAAFQQLQTYKREIPGLFTYNEIMVVSDGLEARAGTLTANWEWFLPWRTVAGDLIAPRGTAELEVLVRGVFEKRRFLDLLRHFVVFEANRDDTTKKMAAYHQFHAVNQAVDCTLKAVSPSGDRRVGVIWHTQGSGKSLSMAFYAGKIVRHPAMENPTIVAITDRNDLDGQLCGVFSGCRELLRQTPVQVESRADLRERLKVAAGGVFFTTIQKFLPETQGDTFPELSDRRNIVVIADEAHRSQYGLAAKVSRDTGDVTYGFAKHMRDALPNASFVGFTGTPIETADRDTRAVFGDYINVYDIERAVEDGATVRIYYEGRLAKIALDDAERPNVDPDFEDVTEGKEDDEKQKLRSKWARLEAVVGSERRVRLVAEDLVDHWEKRLDVIDGKAMVVCMSRRICVELYREIVRLRPDWHDDEDEKGVIKVVMTGSASDPEHYQPHIRNKPRRDDLAARFKDDRDPFKVALVRDMWLTGFDVPCLHTMYVDKPMRSHGLMQAIARVNRVYKDKPGGLVVDYLGVAAELKRALADYTQSGGKGSPTLDQGQAVRVMQEKYEVVLGMMHGFDYRRYFLVEKGERLHVMKAAMEHVLAQEDGKSRYLKAVAALSRAFALSVPHERALAVRDEVGFFQAVRAGIVKNTGGEGGERPREELDAAVRQIVSRAVATDGVIDIFGAAGLDKPEVSILSDRFLAEVKDLPQKNLALEALRKLLEDEIKVQMRQNLVQSRRFLEMLEDAVLKYRNRSLEAAEVIEELVRLAKEMREAHSRGEDLGLTEEEVAFYDALEVNDGAVKVLGDETLRKIAQELVETVRRNTSIDWTMKESVRAKLRALVKRLLRKHGYPPDKCEKATQTVLEQAELLCKDWAA